MKKLLIPLLVLLFVECVPIYHKLNIDSTQRSDTVLFNYKLGDSRAIVEKHTDSLIRAGVLQELTTKVFEDQYLGYPVKFKEEGYPFVLYVDDQSAPAMLCFEYYKDKLFRQTILYTGLFLRKSLSKQYGEPYQNIPTIDDYSIEEKSNISPYSFWNKANKAIYILSFGKYDVLVYEDILAKIDMNKEQKQREEREKDSIRNINLEKSKNVKL